MQEELDTYHEQLAKTYLDHVRDCSTRIQLINEEIVQLKNQLTLSGVNYSEHVSGGSVHKDAIPDGVARMFELIEEYTTQSVEYLEEQRTMHEVLMRLDTLEARVVKERWLDGKQWIQIAHSIGYSFPGVMVARRRALRHVYEVMPNEYKRIEEAV